jgi:hypothetical protein
LAHWNLPCSVPGGHAGRESEIVESLPSHGVRVNLGTQDLGVLEFQFLESLALGLVLEQSAQPL